MNLLKILWDDITKLSLGTKAIAGVLIIAFLITMVHDLRKTTSLDTFITNYNNYKKGVAETIQKNAAAIKVVQQIQHDSIDKANAEAARQHQLAIKNKRLADSANAKAVTYEQQVAELKLLTPTLHTDSAIIAKQDTAIVQKDSSIKSLTVAFNKEVIRGDSLEKSNKYLTISNGILTVSNDSLVQKLYTLPPTPKNPDKLFNIIPLPTRTASAAWGTILGVIGTLVIQNNIHK